MNHAHGTFFIPCRGYLCDSDGVCLCVTLARKHLTGVHFISACRFPLGRTALGLLLVLFRSFEVSTGQI